MFVATIQQMEIRLPRYHNPPHRTWRESPARGERNSMTAILEGFFKEGKLELLESPTGLREGRVRVIVVEDDASKLPLCYMTFGKYQSDRLSSLEDFQDAEWHGEKEFDGPHGQ
jgi:hypothetical protein